METILGPARFCNSPLGLVSCHCGARTWILLILEPRALIRVYVAPGELDGTISFYERLLGVDSDMYMSIPDDPADPDGALTCASVGGFDPRRSPCGTPKETSSNIN